jgi:hypothetical protein
MTLRHIDADSRACSALAGLETGTLATLCLLAWQALGSVLSGRPAWDTSVRLASAVFGEALRRDGVMATAVAGLALQAFGGGLVGIVFGLLLRMRWAARRMVLTGLAIGLAWYYLAYEVSLLLIVPGRYSLSLRLPLIASHLAFGLTLSVYPHFWRSLRQASWSGN